MRTRITLKTFRFVDRQEETMARAMMPKTDAADPAERNLALGHGQDNARWTIAGPQGTRLAKPLTFTMKEVLWTPTAQQEVR